MRTTYVAPSLLSADFLNLNSELKKCEDACIKYLHYDVMDGHFVPNISFGPSILKQVKKGTSMILDVHLMISDPKKYYMDFVKSGADIITFHYESLNSKEEISELINLIKKENVKVGISIKPKTNIDVLYPFIKDIDLILIMSVEPGFGGQKFMESSLEKISSLRNYIDENHYNCLLEVDGGIDDTTAKLVKEAGVDLLVAGSYLFGHSDFKERYNKIK